MKLIDEQGRLFGKINVIDFLAILFLFLMVPMFYFGYRVFTKKSPREMTSTYTPIEIELSCDLVKINPQILSLIKAGDKEIDIKGKTKGEILWLGEAKPYQYIFFLDDREKITMEDTVLKEIPAKIRLNAEIADDQLYYKRQPIRLSSPIYFKTSKYAVTVIPTIDLMDRKERVFLYVIFKGLGADTFRLISVGDKELSSNWEIIAEVLSIGNIENETRNINLGDGNFVLGEAPEGKQVVIKMQISGVRGDNDTLYFKGRQILHNSSIEFKTDKYTLKGRVAKSFSEKAPTLEEKLLKIQVKVSGLIPEVAKIINEGDVEKDPSGKTVMVLKKIVVNRPSDILTLREDKFSILAHPFLKDMVLLMDVVTIDKEGVLCFKNYPVKIGNNITFTTELYSVTGVITSIEQL